jgi:integral membrane sensor domain MASE1
MDALENDSQLAANRRIAAPFAGVTLPWLLLFAVGFCFAYKYATLFTFNSSGPLWFPDSVLFCALLIVPRREWWIYLLISLPLRIAFEAHSGAPLWFVFVAFANDSFKAALSAYALQQFMSGPVRLNTLRQLAIFIGVAVVSVPALSAVIGGAARRAAGFEFWSSCYTWFLGDATAALIITPTLLYWCLKGWREMDAHVTELAVLVTGLAVCLYFTFLLSHANYSPIVLYAPVPFLIWPPRGWGRLASRQQIRRSHLCQ